MHSSLYAVFNKPGSVREEICQHLSSLLNARRGSLVALPDYGLPEFLSIFRSLPNGLYDFLNLIKQNIERYEPRLRNVCVELDAELGASEVLQLRIKAEDLHCQAMLFKTMITRFDGVNVVSLL